MIDSIKEDFPLQALFTDEEKMHLGEFSIDQAVLQDIFGVKDFKELREGLTLAGPDTPPPLGPVDPPGIVFQARTKKGEAISPPIPIAEMKNRPDGIAYGESWKLEFKLHKLFKKSVKKANKNLGRTQ